MTDGRCDVSRRQMANQRLPFVVTQEQKGLKVTVEEERKWDWGKSHLEWTSVVQLLYMNVV